MIIIKIHAKTSKNRLEIDIYRFPPAFRYFSSVSDHSRGFLVFPIGKLNFASYYFQFSQKSVQKFWKFHRKTIISIIYVVFPENCIDLVLYDWNFVSFQSKFEKSTENSRKPVELSIFSSVT